MATQRLAFQHSATSTARDAAAAGTTCRQGASPSMQEARISSGKGGVEKHRLGGGEVGGGCATSSQVYSGFTAGAQRGRSARRHWVKSCVAQAAVQPQNAW